MSAMLVYSTAITHSDIVGLNEVACLVTHSGAVFWVSILLLAGLGHRLGSYLSILKYCRVVRLA